MPAPKAAPRPAPETRRPPPAPGRKTDDSQGRSAAMGGIVLVFGSMMLIAVALASQSSIRPANRAAPPTRTLLQPAAAPQPEPATMATPVASPKKKPASACERAKARLRPEYRLNDDCSALAVLLSNELAPKDQDPKSPEISRIACALFPTVPASVNLIYLAVRLPSGEGRPLTIIPRSVCRAAEPSAAALEQPAEPEPVQPPTRSFEAYELEQQARREAARRAREGLVEQ